MRALLSAITLAAVAVAAEPAKDPCVSGPAAGQKPGPYSSVVSVGPQRGESCCFICDTADRPAVVVFARTLNDPLGKLAAGLDQAVADHKAAELRAWVTFLADDQASMDPKVVEWGKKHAIRNLPLTVFEDKDGPPSYKLSRDADVTVVLFVKKKVVADFAFREGELTEDRVGEVLKAMTGMVAAEKK
jgi:hypothetical protein